MIRIYLFLTLFFLALSGRVLAQSSSGELRGKVTDNNKAEVPFAAIIVELNGSQVAVAQSDFDGNYSIKPLAPGKYDVRVKILGYNEWVQRGVLVTANKQTYLEPKLSTSVTQITQVDVTEYRIPLIEKDETTTGGTITGEDLKEMPTRNINSIISTQAGIYQEDEGEALNIGGSRTDATEYYIDGVKVRGSSGIPQSGIEQISVITGGLPAQYGDVTGGVVSITTRGPSKDYAGGVELGTSELLDGYGYNLAALNLSGPLFLKDKGSDTERPLVGFFLSGELESKRDQDPSAVQVYRIKPDKLASIQENPRRFSYDDLGDVRFVQEAEFVTMNDLEKIAGKQNNNSRNVTLAGKLDFQPSQTTTFTLGASGTNTKKRSYDDRMALFSPDEMNQELANSYRVYARLTQKFGQSGQESTSLLKNSYYSLQFDFSKHDVLQQDNEHEDRFFNYGHVGKFTQMRDFRPVSAIAVTDTIVNPNTGDTIQWVQTGMYRDTLLLFEGSDYNPLLANYTEQYYSFIGDNNFYKSSRNKIREGGALSNGDNADQIYGGLYFSPGTQLGVPNSGQYNHINRDQFRMTANASTDLKDHSLQFGVEYEQRFDRQYIASPMNIWTTMRQLTNSHIQMNTADTIWRGDTIFFDRKALASEQSYFDKNLRAKLGAGETDIIDIDSYDPSTFSMDMFSASELLDPRIVTIYHGYDYTGKKSANKVGFMDFFNDTINRPVGAFQPIYIAGYVQDKFTFKDIIFNLGVRVDRFDANMPVLKDRYSLYDVRTKGEVSGSLNTLNGGVHPSTIGEDFVVYVEDELSGERITGYRSGDQFYDALGNETDIPEQLKNSSGKIVPYLSEAVKRNSLGKPIISESSFDDYEPKLSVMPRVSFSFPISDEAVFFANYDVLTQRPRNTTGSSLTYTNPINLYRYERGETATIASPDLRNEKTISYQFGFKQKVSNSSAVAITVGYKELKDNFQVVTVQNAYPYSYTSFQNIDFGTVKSLTASYDLRRTRNMRLNAAYTLQFAEGTGSTSTAANNLLNVGEGNLRIPIPLDYDQRHTIVTTVDYRYGAGTKYDGPAWGRGFFENFGANFIFRAGSGVPYSRISQEVVPDLLNATDARFRKLVGDINGSRLPWQFKVDMRLDKDISLSPADADGNIGQYVNVYLQVQNLFDAKNIVDIYEATGNPDDDGYLSSSQGKAAIENQTNPQSYVDLYRLRLVDPDNYSLPRTIRVGATYNF